MIYMVNTGEQALTVNVEGLPEGRFTHIQTTEKELETTIGTYQIPNETVTLHVPGMSIHVLSTRTY